MTAVVVGTTVVAGEITWRRCRAEERADDRLEGVRGPGIGADAEPAGPAGFRPPAEFWAVNDRWRCGEFWAVNDRWRCGDSWTLSEVWRCGEFWALAECAGWPETRPLAGEPAVRPVFPLLSLLIAPTTDGLVAGRARSPRVMAARAAVTADAWSRLTPGSPEGRAPTWSRTGADAGADTDRPIDSAELRRSRGSAEMPLVGSEYGESSTSASWPMAIPAASLLEPSRCDQRPSRDAGRGERWLRESGFRGDNPGDTAATPRVAEPPMMPRLAGMTLVGESAAPSTWWRSCGSPHGASWPNGREAWPDAEATAAGTRWPDRRSAPAICPG